MMGLASEPPSGSATPGPAAPGAAVRKRMPWSELGPRIASALVMMALALGVTSTGGVAFDLLWLVAALAILGEWQVLIGGGERLARIAVGGLAIAAAALLVEDARPGMAVLAVLAGTLAVAGLAAPGRRLMSAAGVPYAGALVVAVEILRHSSPYGVQSILWLFAVVWGTDCMAFFGGRLIGGPKLYPRFSPSKTWSGFVVGIVCGSLLGLLAAPDGSARGAMVGLGLLAGCVAQGGDLFESALKRRFGVKDASSLIPGHGGVMDRLDGFIASAAFAACLGVWRYGANAAGLGLFHW